ncbi:MAG: flavodoxin domain-containing protein [Thermodesulfobacteriota bacterium]
MRRVLLCFDTRAGSTARTADMLASCLRELGASADAVPLSAAKLPGPYDMVVLASPLRFGRPTGRLRRFLADNREALSHVKLSLFFTCLVLWTVEGASKPPFPLFMDPGLSGPPKKDRFLNMVEFAHTLSFTSRRLEKALAGLSPDAVGFLRGSLDFSRLGIVDKLCMLGLMVFVRETVEGDFVSPDAVRAFAETLLA